MNVFKFSIYPMFFLYAYLAWSCLFLGDIPYQLRFYFLVQMILMAFNHSFRIFWLNNKQSFCNLLAKKISSCTSYTAICKEYILDSSREYICSFSSCPGKWLGVSLLLDFYIYLLYSLLSKHGLMIKVSNLIFFWN